MVSGDDAEAFLLYTLQIFNLFFSAVMLMFIFGIVLAAVALVMFVAGVSSDRIVCYPLRNPDDSKVVTLLDDYLRQSSGSVDFSVRNSLASCYGNESIYNVLNLKSQFDVDAISDKFDISSFLEEMYTHLNGIIDNDFEILSDENVRTLESLKDFDPSINFDQFQDEVRGMRMKI